MHSELHGNVVHHGVELLLLVSKLFLLAIPKALLILMEFLYTSIFSNSSVAASVSVSREVSSEDNKLIGHLGTLQWPYVAQGVSLAVLFLIAIPFLQGAKGRRES